MFSRCEASGSILASKQKKYLKSLSDKQTFIEHISWAGSVHSACVMITSPILGVTWVRLHRWSDLKLEGLAVDPRLSPPVRSQTLCVTLNQTSSRATPPQPKVQSSPQGVAACWGATAWQSSRRGKCLRCLFSSGLICSSNVNPRWVHFFPYQDLSLVLWLMYPWSVNPKGLCAASLVSSVVVVVDPLRGD
jgi:hypothetical protein